MKMRSMATMMMISVVASLIAGCGKQGEAVSRGEDVMVLCGGSMRAPLEELKKRYEAISDDTIVTTYGGSGELCAQIEKTGRGDLYLCHDPFMPWAAERKLISEWETVAVLRIVMIVPKGNPKGIKKLGDLGTPGLRIGIGNRTYSTSGQIIKHVLAQRPFGETVLKNVRVETKGHQQRCNDVAMGSLDASVVWDAVASLYPEKLDALPIDMTGIDAITSATYKKSDIKKTGVTLGIVKGAKDRAAVRKFYEFAKQEAPKVFAEKGFVE
ncbi:MAG: substrate-binding domain-containing protein [Kiritimatiellae bacterium]|jgi:molybdenum ABC transporter molybdate-binding protein|nr:substrate-binding domain-containing protein [Kiritimatiellia bacterium]